MGGRSELEKVANVAIKKAKIFHQLISTDIHSSYGAKLKIQNCPKNRANVFRVLHEVALGGKPKTLALMVEHRAILSIRLLSDWAPVFDLRLRCELP